MHIMSRLFRRLPLCVTLCVLWSLGATVAARAEQRALDADWRFHPGEVQDGQSPIYDDHDWTAVTAPHDFSVMNAKDGRSPFDPNAVSGQDSGYLSGGVGWYRRHLNLSAADAAKALRLNFGAVYMNAEVWINGVRLASHAYGYTAFSVDLTGHARAGDNVIAVRVDHRDPSSRWYAGSGLIRPVSLDVMNCLHIAPESVAIQTPVATTQTGLVKVDLDVANCGASPVNARIYGEIRGADGTVVGAFQTPLTPAAKATSHIRQQARLDHPALWSPDHPNLYTLRLRLDVKGAERDALNTRFGVRVITLDARNGLRINGQPVKLRGGNIYHDNYMLGAAGLPDADARKVALMKAAGYNAIRSAHNPASQATLEAADELGMLVIDEAFDAWHKDKRPEDYAKYFADNWRQDIDSLVVSGRNHPSVVFWSIGNEIPEQGSAQGVETARALIARVRALDASRPITEAVSIDPPGSDLQFAPLDVAGYNYRVHLFASDHEKFPDRVMFTSESTSKDAFEGWRAVETMPWVIGDFVWTAVDYIGESGIGWMGYSQDWQKLAPYPWNLAYSGEIDATGRKRPAAYYREVLWKTGIDPISAFVRQPAGTEDLPDRHLFPITPPHLDWSLDDVHPSWTWPGQEGKPLEVDVYSEFPEVELFLNSRSLGRKAVSVDTRYMAVYQVPYAPGELTAVGYRDGKAAGQWRLRTAGAPAQLKVACDRLKLNANGEDLAYISIQLIDANGAPIYATADDRTLRVNVTGVAALAGLGNGDPHDASSFTSGERKSFHGHVVAVIRAGFQPGAVTVTIDGDGLPARQVRLNVVSAPPTDAP
jgi:beta-galactosidase